MEQPWLGCLHRQALFGLLVEVVHVANGQISQVYPIVACEAPGHHSNPDCTLPKDGVCNGRVRNGKDDRWTAWKSVSGQFECSMQTWGPVEDPYFGMAKECQCDDEDIQRQRPLPAPVPAPAPSGVEESPLDGHEPGAVHWALAAMLAVVLVSGLFQVYRALSGLDVMSTALRNVPEGMRPAECGACHTMQHVSSHGRIFICFCCHSANRIPRDAISRSENPLLVTATGPLRSYEFRKKGENIWQELSQREVPETQNEEGAAVERVAESEVNNVESEVNNVEAAAEAEATAETNVVQPQTVGRPQADQEPTEEHLCQAEVRSERSSRIGEDGLPVCVVCLDKSGCMVLLPCAHGGVCEECATRIAQNRAMGGAHCPHCRAVIETLVKLSQVDGDVAKGTEVRIPMARPP